MISGWALRIRKINCQSGGLLLWSGSVVCSPTFFFFLSTAAYDNSKIRIFFFFFFSTRSSYFTVAGRDPLLCSGSCMQTEEVSGDPAG